MNALGWLPDRPDHRDFTRRHPQVRGLLAQTRFVAGEPRPPIVDLREGCSPVENQLTIGSCTANAAAGVVEFMERRAFGQYTDASRLFLYKKTRDLMGLTGDTGATLRDTMRALARFGVPPEPLWPYDIARFDEEPPAEVTETATHYRALEYFRLDPPNTPLPAVLDAIRDAVASGLPAMFGFTVYRSLWDRRDGGIPYPSDGDSVEGGHAVCLVGDTQLPLLNGTESTLGELAESGRSTWVYSCDRTGNIAAGRAHSARRTRAQASVWRVVLDSGESLRCTPDHLLMLRDGTYRACADLRPGDSLMPLYRRPSRLGYEMVFVPSEGAWRYTHRVIAGEPPFRREGPRVVVHHGARTARTRFHNHQVVSVQRDGVADVYDLTVEGVHNFAISAGVFVHNCAVGFDDAIEILGADNRTVTRGALLVRNSWGSDWGEQGVGWLPYQYALDGLAADFWCVLKQAWVATGAFR